jgi:acyl-CoA thioester hydrolase
MGVEMTVGSFPGPVDAAEYGVLMPTWVYFDDMDPFGMLNNNKYSLLTERAWNTYWEIRAGRRAGVGDGYHVIKEAHITHDAPVTSSGPYAVHLWIERIGTTSVTWGFRFCSVDEAVTYAHGTRTSIHLAPETLRPAPWNDETRQFASEITRPAALPRMIRPSAMVSPGRTGQPS